MRFALLIPAVFGLNTLAATLIGRNMPHLLVWVDSRTPDQALGTQFWGDVEHAVNTEVSFDVPSNGANNCKLNFFISLDNTKTSPWELWGAGPLVFNISTVASPINKDTDTWNKRPVALDWVASVEVTKQGAVTIKGGDVPCKKGQVAQYVLYPGSDRDFGLKWQELVDPLHGITYDMYV